MPLISTTSARLGRRRLPRFGRRLPARHAGGASTPVTALVVACAIGVPLVVASSTWAAEYNLTFTRTPGMAAGYETASGVRVSTISCGLSFGWCPLTLKVVRNGAVVASNALPDAGPSVPLEPTAGDVAEVYWGEHLLSTATYDGGPSLDDLTCAVAGRTTLTGHAGAGATSASVAFGTSGFELGKTTDAKVTGDRFTADLATPVTTNDRVTVTSHRTTTTTGTTLGDITANIASATSVTVCPITPDMSVPLAEQIRPSGSQARIGALLRANGYRMKITAAIAGIASVNWVLARGHVEIANAQRTFHAPGTSTVLVKLTRPGRLLLKHAKRVQIRAFVSVAPVGEEGPGADATFPLRR